MANRWKKAIAGRTTFRLSEAASDKSVVLVDVFDTVIFRETHPLRLLETWASRMIAMFTIPTTPEDLTRIRRNAYADLLRDREEATLNEILTEVLDRLVTAGMVDPGLDVGTFCAAGHEVELLIDASSQYANHRLAGQLREWKALGKSIYCLSDHYLSSADIQEFLDRLGLADLFTDVFVSSEFATSKRSGNLYKLIIDRLGVAPHEIVMIGDNAVSDHRNAIKAGLAAIHIPNRRVALANKKQLLRPNAKLRARQLKGVAKTARGSDHPFSEYTVLFFVFIERLYAKLKANEADSVIFFSREGYTLRRLFDTYQEICIPPDQRVRSGYLKASRRSVQGLSLKNLDEEDFGRLGAMNVQSFLKAVGIDVAEFRSSTTLKSLNMETVIEEFSDSAELNSLKADPAFIDAYRQARTEAPPAFTELLGQLAGSSERLHFVDVGWKGTMQNGISRFTGLETFGYYIGIIVEGQNTNFNRTARATGLIFSNYPHRSQNYDVLRTNTQILEQLLSAPHGSPFSYGYDADGAPVSKDDWVEDEQTLYHDLIKGHQAFSLDLFRELCQNAVGNPDKPVETEILTSLVMRSALFGTRKRIAFLDRLDEGFVANFNSESRGLRYDVGAVDLGLREVILSPERLLRYYAKLQRHLKRRRIPLVYKVVTPFYFTYLKLTMWLKRRTGDSVVFQGRI